VKPFQEYAAHGYYVDRGAIPTSLVRDLVKAFHGDAKTCPAPILRQNGQREVNAFDAHGFITQPFLDPHLTTIEKLASFKDAILALACSEDMRSALARITLQPDHSMQQIMVFEQSATAAHQDWFYLDTFPPGHMTAAWVALEDIDPAATRFFIVPGSQDFDEMFPQDWVDSNRYTEAMMGLLRERFSSDVTIPPMNAGDVLFWSSRLIHGSLPGTDTSKSRLSLTAHYIPKGYSFGSRHNPIHFQYPFNLVEGRPIPFLDRSIL
jgi:phytanoyl-CoA hydroxylase